MGLFGDCEPANDAGVSSAGAIAARFSTYPGGRGGKERAARHERSSDWPRGAEPPAPERVNYTTVRKPPEQTDTAATASRGARQGRLLSEALRRRAAGVDRTRTVLLFGNHTTPSTATMRRNKRQVVAHSVSTPRCESDSSHVSSYARSLA